MIIKRKHFPSIIPDNHNTYFRMLAGIIESVDINASMLITKKKEGINFRINPSSNLYTNSLIEEINKLHNLYSLKVDYSKSIKQSSTICFYLPE